LTPTLRACSDFLSTPAFWLRRWFIVTLGRTCRPLSDSEFGIFRSGWGTVLSGNFIHGVGLVYVDALVRVTWCWLMRFLRTIPDIG
jgi:hypothetical protein